MIYGLKQTSMKKIVDNFCQNFNVPLIFKMLLLKSILYICSYGETLCDIFIIFYKTVNQRKLFHFIYLFSEMYLFFPSLYNYHLVFARDQGLNELFINKLLLPLLKWQVFLYFLILCTGIKSIFGSLQLRCGLVGRQDSRKKPLIKQHKSEW